MPGRLSYSQKGRNITAHEKKNFRSHIIFWFSFREGLSYLRWCACNARRFTYGKSPYFIPQVILMEVREEDNRHSVRS